jgi:hypothetical protein
MTSGVFPPPGQGRQLTAGIDNYFWPVSSFNVGGATNCMVISTANVCMTETLPANGYYTVAAAMQAPTGPPVSSTEGPWLSPSFANSPNAYSCSAGTTAFTFSVTPNNAYSFGCKFDTQIPIPGAGAAGAYCQVAVACF